MVFGDPNDDRVIVTHHTLVRPNGGEHATPPELADQLPLLQDRLLAGDLTVAEEFTDGRPLQRVQPFHRAEWAWPGLDDTYDHRHLSHPDFLRSATAPPARRRRLRPHPGAAVDPQQIHSSSDRKSVV